MRLIFVILIFLFPFFLYAQELKPETEVKRSPTIGEENAPFYVIEFVDYQ